MCGIVGYIGEQDATSILLNGLKRLEYRGYDSAGVAVVNGGLTVKKRVGKVSVLDRVLQTEPVSGTVGIGHTRWATHGAPNDLNAHPHTDEDGEIALIHNGIIENYAALKKKLAADGYTFRSETDTEVLVVLIRAFYDELGDMAKAFRYALKQVVGAYGIAMVSAFDPNRLYVARNGSPLAIGIGDGEFIVASDASAIVQHTRQVVYLDDGEMAVIERDRYVTKRIDDDTTVDKEVEEVEFDLAEIEKGGYDHFMLKEIFEQPETIRNAMRGRLDSEASTVRLGGLMNVIDRLRDAQRLIIVGCGTSFHAGLVGEYLIEGLAGIPVEVEYASEFRYRDPIITKDDIVIAISQSGETSDTLAALREAKRRGAMTLGIVNVVGSSIARETDAGVYSHAGPEIGVASTKAFTSQLMVLALMAVKLARMKRMSASEGEAVLAALRELPEKVEYALSRHEQIQEIAKAYAQAPNFLYLGRGYNYPVALEGALKLKEISYIHAEGYPAAEMKHGPIALIDENMPVVFIAAQDGVYNKVVSNIEEVRARNGRVIAITNEGNQQIEGLAEHVIYVPETLPFLSPIINVLPLQLLSYYMAVERGCNVDQPRNLAKSVTVE
ncbi:MAG: glutamine--fructose-6-phosphate transaminase (isomerizing) [Ignavibacteriae bacterium]|nr:glutamine--fructose-6-phosphate transaminase (isomerizing) [Ignavibacteriota bacterium]MCB9217646.1 glutamine--fructose-6-phosphate transaminase (isomerizing) [Ignavibacteria bacterium]